MTLGLYARRKQWPLEAVRVRLRHSRVHAADCENCETEVGMIDHIEREIELLGSLDEDQRARLLDIADKCPVHRTLTSEIAIRSRLLPRA
jgi:putative redox protein